MGYGVVATVLCAATAAAAGNTRQPLHPTDAVAATRLHTAFVRTVPRELTSSLRRHQRRRSGRRGHGHLLNGIDAQLSATWFTPTQFGGDPTGKVDSTAAVQACVDACVNRSEAIPGMFPVGARDAGGCRVALEGGEFLISKTITIPSYVSNMQIQGGSLVADPTSPFWNATQADAAESSEDSRPGAKAAAAAKTGDCSDKTFGVNLTGKWCMSLGPAPTGTTPETCVAACCAQPGCNVWQFCPPTHECFAEIPQKLSCWLGSADDCSNNPEPSGVGWTGGARTHPITPPPPAAFMIQVGGTLQCNHPQGSCNEDIGLPGLFLDGSGVAAGIHVISVMGTTIGPTNYLLNFSGIGIHVSGGHEVMISETWLGETNFDFRFNNSAGIVPTANAIQIDGNDHYIEDSIVFSSLVGLQMNGAANYVGGLHVWFPWNAAGAFTGCLAFVERGGQNRYEGCYIDSSHMLFENPSMVTFQDGFVLGGGIEITGRVAKFVIADTEFQGGTITDTGITSMTDTTINRNIFTGGSVASTATAIVNSTEPISAYTVDFCSALVYPNITAVRYSFTANTAGQFPAAVARPVVGGCKVVVEVDPSSAGTMIVDVDASIYT